MFESRAKLEDSEHQEAGFRPRDKATCLQTCSEHGKRGVVREWDLNLGRRKKLGWGSQGVGCGFGRTENPSITPAAGRQVS